MLTVLFVFLSLRECYKNGTSAIQNYNSAFHPLRCLHVGFILLTLLDRCHGETRRPAGIVANPDGAN